MWSKVLFFCHQRVVFWSYFYSKKFFDSSTEKWKRRVKIKFFERENNFEQTVLFSVEKNCQVVKCQLVYPKIIASAKSIFFCGGLCKFIERVVVKTRGHFKSFQRWEELTLGRFWNFLAQKEAILEVFEAENVKKIVVLQGDKSTLEVVLDSFKQERLTRDRLWYS